MINNNRLYVQQLHNHHIYAKKREIDDKNEIRNNLPSSTDQSHIKKTIKGAGG